MTYLVHDSYYRDLSEKPMNERALTNFDHPDSLDTKLMVQHIRDLKRGQVVEAPVYDFTTHTRVCRTKSVELHGPKPILLLEGILILCYPELVEEMNLKVFVVRESSSFLSRPWLILCNFVFPNISQWLSLWTGCLPGYPLYSALESRLR